MRYNNFKIFNIIAIYFNLSYAVNAEPLQLHNQIHPLLPLTTKEQVADCSKYFNLEKEYTNALSCANSIVFSKEPYNIILTIKPPECKLITIKSKDIIYDEEEEYFYIPYGLFRPSKIVGFYEKGTVYIVENKDAHLVYSHEVNHYFLEYLIGNGDSLHLNKIWYTCQTPYYTPPK